MLIHPAILIEKERATSTIELATAGKLLFSTMTNPVVFLECHSRDIFGETVRHWHTHCDSVIPSLLMKGTEMQVLLAVDHSPASDSAVACLRALPFCRSVDLQVVSVVAPFPFAESLATSAPLGIETLLEQERQHAEQKLTGLMAQFDDDAFRSVNGEVRIGPPGHELTEFAERHGTNLIVMGAVGRSAIERVLLGSVSEYVANRTGSSVLIVRSRTSETTTNEPKIFPRRILLALDNSDQDVDVAIWLRHLELPTSTEIHLVHVMQLLTSYRNDLAQQTTETWKQLQAAAESRAELLTESIGDWGLAATSRVVAAPHIGDALISYADEHDCDLIVTGDGRRGVLNRLFLGSVSRHVLRHAKCSVLVAREE